MILVAGGEGDKWIVVISLTRYVCVIIYDYMWVFS